MGAPMQEMSWSEWERTVREAGPYLEQREQAPPYQPNFNLWSEWAGPHELAVAIVWISYNN